MKKLRFLQKNKAIPAFCPVILNSSKVGDRAMLRKIRKDPRIVVNNHIREQLLELFLVRRPELKKNPDSAGTLFNAYYDQLKKKKKLESLNRWVYFPWSHHLVCLLKKDYFWELRTARNRNLITLKEQQRIRSVRVNIAGLSVGNSAAIALCLEGFEIFSIVDFDELGISNLNRLSSSVEYVGENKAVICARRMYEINPYASIRVFTEKLEDKELKKFVQGPPHPDIIVDEMDDLTAKMSLRVMARSSGIPVISVADNGDGGIADVERFDTEPRRKPFHGLMGRYNPSALSSMGFSDRMKLINRIVGVDYVVGRMKESLLQVGTLVYSWPQLGGAAMLSGAAVVYLAKKIAIGEVLQSGKYEVSLDRVFTPSYDSAPARRRRKNETRLFIKRQEKKFQSK